MNKITKIPRMLLTLILVALVVATISGIMLVQRAQASELKGTAENLTATSIIINGQTIIINANTKIEGTLSAGAKVEVEAVRQANGSLLALEIEVENDEDSDEDVDEVADAGEDDEEDED